MKTLMILALAVLMTGCSVNVIVAPHAVLAVDSANDRADTVQAFHAKTVEVLP